MASSDQILAELRAICGAKHVIVDAPDTAPFLVERRDLYHGRALAVVAPGALAEVAAILRTCHVHAVPVVPQGGNTGLVGGQIPDQSGRAIVLLLTRLAQLREIDLGSNTMVVEAGMTLAAVQQAAANHDRLFPLSLASEGTCTIGGNLATNAGGIAVLHYGNARDLVLGLEVVLADGRILSNLSKVKKDNTGYDLKHLFMGSEGTLGIITAAVLKLFPRPAASASILIALDTPQRALQLLGLAQAICGDALVSFELMPRIGIDFVLRHAAALRDPFADRHAWYVLVELIGPSTDDLVATRDRLMETGLAAGVIEDAVVATSLAQSRALWSLRERLSEVQRLEGGSIKHDISVPVAKVPAFIEAASGALVEAVPGGRVVAFGHLGDGNLHFNLSQPPDMPKAEFLARQTVVNQIVHAMVMGYGGSIAAEHGIGQLKRDLLAAVKDPVALDVMRAVKQALDPQGILNPGKVL
jgi:FAD/FMN-containing dehydrogenase